MAFDFGALTSYLILGLVFGAAYAVMASGLVLTYSTTRVFNVAHGAVAMIFSFVYWDFTQRQKLPTWLALFLVLFVLAPLFGVLLQRVLGRGLGAAPIGVSLVVTVGLMVGLIGAARKIWPDSGSASIPYFFDGHQIKIGESIIIEWHYVITVIVSIVVAALLYLLLNQTRIGTAMRASVDNPTLLQLYGGRPQLVDVLAWAIGSSLAALAGILLTPMLQFLNYYDMTLLVITAYAAAMLGKLTDLKMTYVGAMLLGLINALAAGYLSSGAFSGFREVLPAFFLFAILVLLPQAPLRIGQVKGLVSAPVPTLRKAAVWGAILIGLVTVVGSGLGIDKQIMLGTAAAYGIIMLSLVLLTGYGGYVSLGQLAFAGVGAVVYARFDQPNLIGLAAAVLVAAALGALVAIPVLRLTGLYLALATMAFAQIMDKVFFGSAAAFEHGNPLSAKRLSILGLQFSNTWVYTAVMWGFFVVVAIGILAVRQGRAGRMLIAMRDSQAACGTLGLDLRWFRVALFAASAGVAGLAGALLAGLLQSIDNQPFQFFDNMPLLLAAVVWGVTSVTGALLGGFFMMYLPQAPESISTVLFMIIGFGAILLARDPNGLANRMFGFSSWVMNRLYPTLSSRFPGMALGDSRQTEKQSEAAEAPAAAEFDAEEVTEDAVALS